MGDQRQKFRIRLPWSIPSKPAPRPATVTKRVPSRVTSTQNTAPASESKTSTQPNANPTTSTAQRAPSRSPGVSQTQTPKPPPQSPTSTKTDSQPTTTESPDTTAQATITNRIPTPSSSTANQPSGESKIPSKTTHTPMVPDDLTSPLRSPKQFVSQNSLPQAQASPKTESQPSSSSPAGFGSRTSTQTASQTRASAQRPAKSQPPSPSNTSQSRPPSQPPSPSHPSFQTVSQSSSPAHSQQKNSSPILRQPRSPSHQPSGQTTKNMQLTSGIPAQTSSPSKTLNPRESTMPPPTSSNSPSPVSESKRRALSQPQPLEAQPAPRSTEPTLMTAKKMAENTNAVENQEMVAQKEASRLREHTKEPSGIAFQAEEKKQETRELLKKEVLNSNTPTSNGKQSKTMAPQQRNKNMAGESLQRPMASNREGVSMQKEIKNDISKFAHSMATEQKKPVRVITLVGENKGATMQIGSDSAKREAAVHIHRGYKLNSDESAETTSDGEETSQKRRGAEANTKENQTTKAYMNSNTQGLNNSLLFNTSIAERNPGVHLVLSRNPTEPIKMDNSTNNLEAHKAEASITPSQKLTYEPTIRRRCLRGLLMESSDSEPDNPEKPRRHGCRCSYGDINKDTDIELL